MTNVRTQPAQPNPGDLVTFYVTFFNNSGSTGPTPWIVKVFRCEAACTGDELVVNKSIGETPKTSVGVPVGTKELAVGSWQLGTGACNLVASPYYIDPVSGQVLPYAASSGGDRFYYNFKGCQ